MMIKKELAALCFSLFLIVFASSCANTSPSTSPSQVAQTDAHTVADSITEADKLYAQREDVQHVREALVLLRQARATDPSSYDVAWRISRCDYYLGAHTKDTDERDKAFTDGIVTGHAAARMQDGKPEGHFWLGANYGGQAQTMSLESLSSVDDIRTEMAAVLRIDEGFQQGSAYMVLGQVDLDAPKMFGGDPQRALENLEKGLKFGGNNALLRLHLARAYLAVNR
ncbi:MAG: TRAP transporter TatT component family protein, partial [Pyrinomonadaceae bacterium]